MDKTRLKEIILNGGTERTILETQIVLHSTDFARWGLKAALQEGSLCLHDHLRANWRLN